jgi:hypothetical protein
VLVCALEDGALQPNLWRLLGCALPAIALLALDRAIGRLLGASKYLADGGYLIGLRVGMWGFAGLMVVSWVVRLRKRSFAYWHSLSCLWLSLGAVALACVLWTQIHRTNPDILLTARNFYGVLTVFEHNKDDPLNRHLLLQHGRITHGLQFVDGNQADWPTTYYGSASGIGMALNALPAGHRRIGVVGLGTGTIASYGEAGDYLRVYEINPQVIELARSRFTYLRRCAAKTEVVPGDARLSLEREPPQAFDVLALDAFSSDSVPVHLLTREAFEIYNRHLQTNGILAIHISNHFLDLAPVVLDLAREFHYGVATIDYDEVPEDWWLYSSTWMLLTRDQLVLDSAEISMATSPSSVRAKQVRPWTDDFASLFQILK